MGTKVPDEPFGASVPVGLRQWPEVSERITYIMAGLMQELNSARVGANPDEFKTSGCSHADSNLKLESWYLF